MPRDLFGSPDPELWPVETTTKTGPAGARSGQVYSVTEVNALVRELLEGAMPPLWISGEVTGWRRYPSGHCYFTLRDESAQLRCVIFRSDASRLPADPEEGMEVRALGTITLYERRGDYQLVVREIEGEGAGGLWRLAFERLRDKLAAEGLLDPARKRPIPRFPKRIGVITSAAGAALHDILQILQRRAPWVRVTLIPALVQGDGAAEDLARALERAATIEDLDLIIIGRGGGSVEDLWAFNEEVLARALAASTIPTISAVGHEIDLTIADLVADLRAPTPSAAAELAVPERNALEHLISDYARRLEGHIYRRISERRGEILLLGTGMNYALTRMVDRRDERLARLTGRLEALSPLSALRRGYAVPLGESGEILRGTTAFQIGEAFQLRLHDGRISCRTEEVMTEEIPGPAGEGSDD